MDGVHVIKATQYTRLKATPKNTGKKATKIYRNIGYNEYTGSKATAFLNTQEKRLHFFKKIFRSKGYTFLWLIFYLYTLYNHPKVSFIHQSRTHPG